MKALAIHAGPRARVHLRERGLRPNDVHVVPAAAGGPKGLVLNSMDKLLLGRWLPQASHPVHLMGSSVGAWRMAMACMNNAESMFERWAHDYVHQTFPSKPGKAPSAAAVTDVFSQTLVAHFGGREAEIFSHPIFRAHVFTSRGRHLLQRDGRRLSSITTPLGYLGAYVSNVASRRAMGRWLERVVFSDQRDALPISLDDFRTAQVALTVDNLRPSILASCSIPFVLESVRDIPGAPKGVYWDGGITDYHLHLNYAAMQDGLVLYPHFQSTVVPGWLDKGIKGRHRATPALDNVIVLSPSPEWVASLPRGKIPDRQDFKTFGHDTAGRIKIWSQVLRQSEQLADELALLLEQPSIQAQALV